MIKPIVIYLLASVFIVLFAHYAHTLIIYIDILYTWLTLRLTPFFRTSELGVHLRNVIVLVLLPLLIAGIPALFYRLIKKRNMPYFTEIVWLLWLIIALSKLLIH